jgi:phage-related tail protein
MSKIKELSDRLGKVELKLLEVQEKHEKNALEEKTLRKKEANLYVDANLFDKPRKDELETVIKRLKEIRDESDKYPYLLEELAVLRSSLQKEVNGEQLECNEREGKRIADELHDLSTKLVVQLSAANETNDKIIEGHKKLVELLPFQKEKKFHCMSNWGLKTVYEILKLEMEKEETISCDLRSHTNKTNI